MEKSKIQNRRQREAEAKFSGGYQKSVFQTLWLAYRPYLARIGFAFSLGLMGRILLLGSANVIGIWVDSFCKPTSQTCKALPTFFQTYQTGDFVSLLLLIAGGGFLLTLTYRTIFSRLSAKAVSQLYDETTYRTSRFPMSFFDSNPAGRIITRFSSDYGNVFRLFGGPLAEFLAIIFDLIAMTILIALASPYYLPMVGLIAILNYGVYYFNRAQLREVRRSISASRSPSIAHFAETAQGANTVRSFNKQKSFFERFKRFDLFYLEQKLRSAKILGLFSLQMNFLTAVLLLATGIMAWVLLQKELLSAGSIGVAFSFVALSGNTVQMFFEWMSQFEEAMTGVERLDSYLRKETEPGALLPAKAQFTTQHLQYASSQEEQIFHSPLLQLVSAEVEFQNVTLRYRHDLPTALKDVSFKVLAGERFGIVGRTGSGKSSLIQALFHLYPLEQGKISVAQVRPRTDPQIADAVDLNLFRRLISFISQDPVLFNGTLLDNLDVDHHLDLPSIFAALQRVGLSDWANPEGMLRPIEERGRNLSLGERQLICMARCLLQACPVVIMDEATSSIDPQSEELLTKATEEFFQDRTQIIIAHRLSTLKKCNRVLWLQNGEIKMLGAAGDVLPAFEAANLSL